MTGRMGAIGGLWAPLLVLAGCGTGNSTLLNRVSARVEMVNGVRMVRVTWPANLFSIKSGDKILEWHIWRKPDNAYNFTGIPVDVAPGGQTTYVELPAPHTAWDGIHSFLAGVPSNAQVTWWLATAVTPTKGPAGFNPGGGPYIYEVSAIVHTGNVSQSIPGLFVDVEVGPFDAEAISP